MCRFPSVEAGDEEGCVLDPTGALESRASRCTCFGQDPTVTRPAPLDQALPSSPQPIGRASIPGEGGLWAT